MVQILKILKPFFRLQKSVCHIHLLRSQPAALTLQKSTSKSQKDFLLQSHGSRKRRSFSRGGRPTDRQVSASNPLAELRSVFTTNMHLSPVTCHLCDCRVGHPPGSDCGGGHRPLRLTGPAELEGETWQEVTASEPAQRHLLLRPHQCGGKIRAAADAPATGR